MRRQGPCCATASLGSTVVVTSENVIIVEGNPYFPAEDVGPGILQPTRARSLCPWKGIASYFDVAVEGQTVPNGAWTYRHPSPLARRIKGRVAFWNGIEVDVR